MAKVSRLALRGDATLHVKRSRDGQWYWRADAANGEPLATSETYTRKRDAIRGAVRFSDIACHAQLIVDE